MKNELKWTRVSGGRLDEYLGFVRMGVSHIRDQAFAFRSLVIEKSQVNYRQYHGNDQERAFRRFIYLLVFHCFCPLLNDEDELVLFLDERDGTSLDELRVVLNRALRSKQGRRSDVIRSAQWVDSKKSAMMQLNDVLMGAVACHNNQKHHRDSNRGRAKAALAAALATEFQLPDLCEPTPRWARHFGIWPLRLVK